MHNLLDLGLSVEVHVALVAELNFPSLECKDRVILSKSGTFACENSGSALSDDDRSWLCSLTRVKLYTQVLWS